MLKTNLNSRVGKVYSLNRGFVCGESPFVSVFEKLKKCDPLKLCNPESEFGMIENCKNCNKKQ